MAQIVDTETVNNFTINKVPTQAIFDDMLANDQVNDNELYIVEGDIVPEPATATPLVDSGSGAVGSSDKYAREDHVHPARTITSSEVTDNSDVGGANVQASLTSLKGSLDTITPFDTTPTNGSTKGVTSGGVYNAVTPQTISGTYNPANCTASNVAVSKINKLCIISGYFQLLGTPSSSDDVLITGLPVASKTYLFPAVDGTTGEYVTLTITAGDSRLKKYKGVNAQAGHAISVFGSYVTT